MYITLNNSITFDQDKFVFASIADDNDHCGIWLCLIGWAHHIYVPCNRHQTPESLLAEVGVLLEMNEPIEEEE